MRGAATHLGACSGRGARPSLRVHPGLPLVQPVRAARARSLTPQITLCAIAYHKAIALTVSKPRTSKRSKPRLRACALTHSAVAARSLEICWTPERGQERFATYAPDPFEGCLPGMEPPRLRDNPRETWWRRR